jgi:hypothetical protein
VVSGIVTDKVGGSMSQKLDRTEPSKKMDELEALPPSPPAVQWPDPRAIEDYNLFIERNGIPLSQYRKF